MGKMSKYERFMRQKIAYFKRKIEVVPCDDVYEERNTQKTCCNKRGYDSREEAMFDMKTMTGRTRKPIRAYLCQEGKWHLTAMSSKTRSERK